MVDDGRFTPEEASFVEGNPLTYDEAAKLLANGETIARKFTDAKDLIEFLLRMTKPDIHIEPQEGFTAKFTPENTLTATGIIVGTKDGMPGNAVVTVREYELRNHRLQDTDQSDPRVVKPIVKDYSVGGKGGGLVASLVDKTLANPMGTAGNAFETHPVHTGMQADVNGWIKNGVGFVKMQKKPTPA